jgi:uncharacterized protein YdhG (YjbR/CyaY superfamily)
MPTANELLAGLTAGQRTEFERVKAAALEEAPGAELVVSYGMLALKYRGKGMLGWQATKNFYSLYPFGKGVIAGMADELAEYKGTVSSLHYPFERPMPAELIRKIVRAKMAEIDAVI